jgi:hypothetical protein
MSFTFDELFSRAPPFDPASEFLGALCTLVVTQEDSRTAFAQGTVQIDPANGSVEANFASQSSDPALRLNLFFSDRQRFAGTGDNIGLMFRNTSRGVTTMSVKLWRWSSQYQVALRLQASASTNGKLHAGTGLTIGNGHGKALHVVSFNDLRVNKIEIG